MPLRDQLKIRDSSAGSGDVNAVPMPLKSCFAAAGVTARLRSGFLSPALPMHPVPENGDTPPACRSQAHAINGFDSPSARDARSNPVGPWAI
jgi:hypothetical protein